MKAPKHLREHDRLAALRAYDILDTPKDRNFDDIVALAAAICETEASTITFVDTDRQWFKADIGMPPGAPAPLNMAICAHTIVADGFLEIPDTRKDARTRDNPGCLPPINLRFYAGAQLISKTGYPIGTLCVLGMTPKSLTPVQRTTLQVLANHVVKLLDLQVALRTADILRQEVDHRVKNSLQLVGSLISMQRRAASRDDVKEALNQTRERVLALASLHATMEQAESGKHVNLRVLIEDMCALIGKSMTDHIHLQVDVADIQTTAKVASSVAVIVNEFASNSLKHGFVDGTPGTISFACHMADDGLALLVCSDDGRGMMAPLPGTDDTPGGLGSVAMQACADQIGAILAIGTPQKGYSMQLRFDPAGI